MVTVPSDSPDRLEAARAVLDGFVREDAGDSAGADGPDADDIEALCRAHPEISAELRLLFDRSTAERDRGDWSGTVTEVVEDPAPEPSADRPGGVERTDSLFGTRSELSADETQQGSTLHSPTPPSTSGTRRFHGDRAASKRYTYLGELGSGGMGKVVEVWDADLERPLAMKVEHEPTHVPAGSTDRKRRRRFLEEAQIMGQLEHPGVVPVHELGVDDEDRVFFTMRLVKGEELQKVIALAREGRQGWTLTRVLGVFDRICETLAFAHSRKVIHRDLKPANIMIGVFGEAYVMDWGLAKVIGGQEPVAGLPGPGRARRDSGAGSGDEAGDELKTQDGTILGTLAYMPPEQARGEVEDLDTRADVYAVGAMLYEVLAGHAPYLDSLPAGSYREFLLAVVAGPPTSLDRLAANTPPELVAICEKAMARERDDRYASARELGDDIRAYLENRVVRAHRTGPWIEIRKWVRRNRGLASAVFLAAVFLIGGLFAVNLVQWSLGRVIARRSYLSNVHSASWQLEKGNLLEARRLLQTCPDDQRGWEWHHLNRELDSSIGVLSAPDHDGFYCIAYRPRDGGLAASASVDGTLVLWDLGRRRVRATLAEGLPPALVLAFSPDGRRLVSGHEGGSVHVWDVDSGENLAQWNPGGARVLAVAFSPDGRRVYAGQKDGSVRRWDLSTGSVLEEMRLGAADLDLTSMAFSPDLRRVIVGARDPSGESHAVRRWDLASRRWLDSLGGHGEAILAVAESPDGRYLASGSGDTTVRLWQIHGGEASFHRSLIGHTSRVLGLAFRPDGSQLVSCSGDKTLRVWDVKSGRLRHVLRGHDREIFSVAFHPDGSRILSGSRDGTVRIWDSRGAGVYSEWNVGAKKLEAMATGDGDRVLTGVSVAGEDELQLWTLRGKREGAALQIHSGDVRSVALAPGSEIALCGTATGSVEARGTAGGAVEVVRTAGHDAPVTALAFRPDGERFVSGAEDGTVAVWNAPAVERLTRWSAHESAVLDLAYSWADRTFASASRDGSVRIWDDKKGDSVRVLKGHRSAVKSVAFSPDGSILVSGSRDKTVRLWAVRSGELLRTLVGHHEGVLDVGFSPDGKRVVSGSWDASVRVWHGETGDLLTILRGPHSEVVFFAAFTPDGQSILSGSRDGVLRLWHGGRGRDES